MWPFDKKAKVKEKVGEYRHWLRGRFTRRRSRYIAIAAISAVLIGGFIYTAAAVNFYNVPSVQENVGQQTEERSPTYELEDKPVNQFPQEDEAENQTEINGEPRHPAQEAFGPGDTGEQTGGVEEANQEDLPLAVPVQGTKIAGYGFHYSEEYGDYRFHKGETYSTGEESHVHPCLSGRIVQVTEIQDGDYRVEVEHNDNLTSIYRGLSSVAVDSGDRVTGQDILGQAAEKVEFTLLKNGEPVNPSQYF